MRWADQATAVVLDHAMYAQHNVVLLCISQDRLICAAEVVDATEELHATHRREDDDSNAQARDVPHGRDSF